MFGLRISVVTGLCAAALAVVAVRLWTALSALAVGDPAALLAIPLTVILPACALGFLASVRGMKTSEGVLMQLGVMIQLVLIIAIPGFALYLALGFPVVFLVVELFETRLTPVVRDPIKRAVLM